MAQRDKVKHKRRYCRVEGCSKIVKSQGLCQRHGARTRLCKIDGCCKQAQGNFDGMCKLHFKITKTKLIAKPLTAADMCPVPVGKSVYDKILPESIGWSDSNTTMPLIAHLKDGFDQMKPRGWHRNEERRARGLPPVTKPAVQLEGWERELVWMEICLLSGNAESSFRALARAWGRDKGFHMVLAQFICERRGNVERKKRVKSSGESAVTKKQRRAPVEMAPSGEEITNVLALDDMEFDMFGVLETELNSSQSINDPTISFPHGVPGFPNIGKRGGKRRPPMEMAPMHYNNNISAPSHPQHIPPPPQHLQPPPNMQHTNITHTNIPHTNMQHPPPSQPDMIPPYVIHQEPIQHMNPMIPVQVPMPGSRMALMPGKALNREAMPVEETLTEQCQPCIPGYDAATVHV